MLIPTDKNTKTITDLRERTLQLLSQVQKDGLAYIFHHSKPRAVILSMDEYAGMLDTLEDHLDTIKARQLEENPEVGGIGLGELAKKYKLNV